MKNRRILALILALIMAVAALTGCAAKEETPAESAAPAESEAPAESAEPEYAVSFTDMVGNEIALAKPVEKIVALTAADCEIVYALGCGDKVVGRGEYCDYPAEVYDIPAVNSGAETNIEQIIALEPDVVVMGTMAQDFDQIKQLQDAGIVCVVSAADTSTSGLDKTYEAIEMLGKLLSAEDKAAAIVDGMKKTFDELSANAAENEGKTVYFEVSPLEWGLWTAGKGTFMDDIANIVGLTNVFADVDGWAEVSEEQVITRDPDYIVTISMYYGEGPTPVEEILGRAGWSDMTAVKNGAVLNADSSALSRTGPRLADAALEIAEFVK